MLSVFTKTLDALVKTLPASVARLLLFTVLIGAALLHFSAISRIESLERGQISHAATMEHMLESVRELTIEVRGYRADVIEQNRELRKVNNKGTHK